MTIKIKLLRHSQYGRERLYPDCKLSKSICLIAGCKTINQQQRDILEAFGDCVIEIEDVKEKPI